MESLRGFLGIGRKESSEETGNIRIVREMRASLESYNDLRQLRFDLADRLYFLSSSMIFTQDECKEIGKFFGVLAFKAPGFHEEDPVYSCILENLFTKHPYLLLEEGVVKFFSESMWSAATEKEMSMCLAFVRAMRFEDAAKALSDAIRGKPPIPDLKEKVLDSMRDLIEIKLLGRQQIKISDIKAVERFLNEFSISINERPLTESEITKIRGIIDLIGRKINLPKGLRSQLV